MYERIYMPKVERNNILFDMETLEEGSLVHKDIQQRHLYQAYKELLWIHANPSNSDVVSYAKNIFIENEQRKNFMIDLENHIKNDVVKLVLLEGKRGSGKTFLQNYFLNIHIPTIENTTWFRVDITKIYNYNHSHVSRSIDFETYLWAQIPFVFFRYCKNHTDNGISYGHDKHFKNIDVDSVFENTGMSKSEYHQFIRDIENIPHLNNSMDGKPFHHTHTKQIAFNILKALNDKKIKVILFIDGIDNVSLSDNKYIRSRDDVNKFIVHHLEGKENEGSIYFNKIIFSSRKELDIKTSLLTTMQDINRYNTISRDLYTSNISILELTYKIIQNLTEKKMPFSDSLKQDLEFIIKTSSSILKNDKNMEDIFVNDIFGGDLREALFALIATYFFVKNHLQNVQNYHMKVNGIYDFFDKKRNVNQKILKELKAVIIEGLFKNGCFYTPDIKVVKYSPPYRGLGFTNIFNPSFYYSLNYNPLVSLYLLKYLDMNDGTIAYDTLLKKCKEYKLCTEKYTSYHPIETLIEYNYFELYSDKKIRNVKITEKGRIVYHMVLSNLDVFSANIYNALQEMNKPLNIWTYETNGKRYRKVQLQNCIVYITFLNKIQDQLINSLDKNLKLDFIENIKIDFIEKLSQQFLTIFVQANYEYEDIAFNLKEQEVSTFDKLLYMPKNYTHCNQKIQNINNRTLYKKLNCFLEDIVIPGTLESLIVPKKHIDTDQVKIIFLYRIFEKRKQYNSKENSIVDFLFDIEDSLQLQNIIHYDNLGLDKLKLVLNEYRNNIGQHIDIWIYISKLLTQFCNYILDDMELE